MTPLEAEPLHGCPQAGCRSWGFQSKFAKRGDRGGLAYLREEDATE
jgi:hypothetical protein